MAESAAHWQPNWFTPEEFDTVIVAFPDTYGRLLGKRMTYGFFVHHTMRSGTHACNYLLTVDVPMNPLPGFRMASWEQGYGDHHMVVDPATLRPLPWLERTALVLCDLRHEDGTPVEESPRRVLARQVERAAELGYTVFMGSELEFFLFDEDYHALGEREFRHPAPASQYLIDYHTLHPNRDEDVLRRIRNEMAAAGVPVEGSKGEWGKGQYELNLVFADALTMADRHVIYKLGAKDIAHQQGRAVTFMAKWLAEEAGSSFHLHTSIGDAAGARNLFWDEAGAPSVLFRQFLGGLMKYGRELTCCFAPTINSYKRYQEDSWAPTRLVWAYDNRTCGFRIVGHGASFRIENRTPGADANPYLAFAATIAAGLAGIEEQLDCGDAYQGNAYIDETLPRLPSSLAEAADLLDGSALARRAFGDDVVDFLVHTARSEVKAFANAVTDWERMRYFEQL